MTTIKVITYPESREAFFEKQLKRAQRGLDNVVKYGTDPDACAEAGETVSFYQDALSALREQAERDKGCDGCAESGKWENEFEYGYPCPCLPCSRRCSDGYKPKEAQHE